MALPKDQERAAVILLSAGAGRISLAGGAALIVHGLVARRTQDLDVFCAHDGNVAEIVEMVTAAFTAAGYTIKDISGSQELRTFLLSGRQYQHRPAGRPSRPVKVQIGRDFQLLEPVPSPVGQTLDPLELGANKILTVYDRPRARDADDLARLSPRLGFERMLAVADRKQVTPPVRAQLAEAFRTLQRISDREFPEPSTGAAVKHYMGALADLIDSGVPPPTGGPYDRPKRGCHEN